MRSFIPWSCSTSVIAPSCDADGAVSCFLFYPGRQPPRGHHGDLGGCGHATGHLAAHRIRPQRPHERVRDQCRQQCDAGPYLVEVQANLAQPLPMRSQYHDGTRWASWILGECCLWQYTPCRGHDDANGHVCAACRPRLQNLPRPRPHEQPNPAVGASPGLRQAYEGGHCWHR